MRRAVSLSLLAATLCLATLQPAAALDRRVRIVNETGYTIVKFYGSNAGADNWEEDILGDSVLPSGESVIINFDDATGYCKFDFRAIFEDDDEVVEPGVNICEVATFTFR